MSLQNPPKYLPHTLLFLFGFLLYANTFTFEFALDDKIVISHNSFTKKGIKGIPEIFKNEVFTGFFGKKKNLVEGGRYRPLTLAYFAVFWDVLGPKKGQSAKKEKQKKQSVARALHINNALFYGLTAMVLYALLLLLFTSKEQAWYQSIAFWTALIYTAHPIHTEVVANIKSLDEIWAFLAGISALYFVLRYSESANTKDLLLASIIFFGGCFAKESIVVFLGIIPLTLFVFKEQKILASLKTTLPLFIIFGFYFCIRSFVLGDVSTDGQRQLLNVPYLYASGSEKIASIFYTMLLYVKLCIFPLELTHDYYPWHPFSEDSYVFSAKNHPYITFSNPLVWCSIGLYLFLLCGGIRFVFSKKPLKIIGYTMLFFVGTFILFSNLFFEIGVFMNERFMYIPSLGIVLLFVFLLSEHIQSSVLRSSILGIVALLFCFKTFSRNKAWKNDQTLAIADYQTSAASAKVNMSAGGAFYDLARIEKNPSKKETLLKKSREALQKSLRLYPNYIQSKTLLGHSLFEAGDYKGSRSAYLSGLQQNPNFTDIEKAIFVIADSLQRARKFQEAIAYLSVLVQEKPNLARPYNELGEIYGKELGRLSESIGYLTKAFEIDPNNIHTLENLGVAYGMSGNFKTSLDYFLRAEKISPQKKRLLENIAKTYMYMNDQAGYNTYMQKAAKAK